LYHRACSVLVLVENVLHNVYRFAHIVRGRAGLPDW